MHFLAKLTVALPALAGVASAAAIRRAVTSDTMITNLQDLTQRSSDLTDVVKLLGPEDQNPATSNYQNTVNGLRDLITATVADATAAGGTEAYADESAQQSVCDTFKTFVNTQQEMLSAFIGKSFIADNGFSGGPIAAGLRSLEGSDDTLAFELIDSVPACAGDATEYKNRLDDSLSKAVCAYSSGLGC